MYSWFSLGISPLTSTNQIERQYSTKIATIDVILLNEYGVDSNISV